ncbi:MAG: hypothetical protein OHK0057_02570 [Thermoflexibacter sp.]
MATQPTPETNISNAYDVIPLGGRLFLIGSDGSYQYSYRANQLDFISQIAVKNSHYRKFIYIFTTSILPLTGSTV